MGYASKLAQSYKNPEATWNSLGSVGSTSAWSRSSLPYYANTFKEIKSETNQQPTRAQGVEDVTDDIINFSKRMSPRAKGTSLEELNAMAANLMSGNFAEYLLSNEMAKQNVPFI